MNAEFNWQQIAEIEALDLSPDRNACVVGKLIVWKLNDSGSLYAIGRTRETAIVTRSWDWRSIQAVIDVDQNQEMLWREHNARLTK